MELALKIKRVIITHDIETFPAFAYTRILKGENIFGGICVLAGMPIGDAINELEIIITCSNEDEFQNRVEYLPLGL